MVKKKFQAELLFEDFTKLKLSEFFKEEDKQEHMNFVYIISTITLWR